MDYQMILDLVAPLDAFVVQHRFLADLFHMWIPLWVLHVCRKKYGMILDTKEPGDGYGFLGEQAKSEWESWKKYRK